MLIQLLEIFINVVVPVFGLVGIGYLAQPRLGLEARTLSRVAYFILIPAFVFKVLSTADAEARLVLQMLAYMLTVQLATAVLAYTVARLLRRPASMVGAYVLIAVFGNVGNFGLPLIQFRLGDAALLPATIYFLVIMTSGFIMGVAAASWSNRGRLGAVLAVFKTPALIALPPAILLNSLNLETPLLVTRMVDLLAGAMIPAMLLTLGLQLASTSRLRIDRDTLIASGLRLVGGPLLALLLVSPFGLDGVERATGVIQAAMPAAILTAIIALEHELLPEFVTTAVLFSTLASLITLTLILTLI